MSHDPLAPRGALAQAIPDYEDRPQQRAMARAVADALLEHRPLVVEAGTGTGKTLAYLIPALQSGRKVVVSTGTKVLQQQISDHDVPLLRDLLPFEFAAVTLKGTANYLCLRRLASQSTALIAGLNGSDHKSAIDAIWRWAGRTEVGDRAEVVEIGDNHPVWSQVTTTPENRLGPRCSFFERCFVTKARRRAEHADLVVVNHHLFFSDLALRSQTGGARVLPDYDVVIFDEAHQLEDVITDHFGIAISSVRVGQLLRELRSADHPRVRSSEQRMVDNLEQRLAELLRALGQHLAPLASRDSERIELPCDLFAGPREDAWFSVDSALEEVSASLQLNGEEIAADDDEQAEKLRLLAARCAHMRNDLAQLAERKDNHSVYWGRTRGNSVSLGASPVEVGSLLNKHLLANVPSTVFTSATLSVGDSFEYIRTRLGLPADEVDAIRVESPFDYATQALLYLARDLPDPSQPAFADSCFQRICQLLQVTAGRAFVLFTSHRALTQVARRMTAASEYPLLIQGQAPRAELLRQFRACANPVLLATGAFWEGVDIPGDALSQVIIDKLPFAPPTDPLTRARMQRLEKRNIDPFTGYQVPQAALLLRQGVGRLIRRRTDRGLISLLDGRILSRSYGRMFFAALPSDLGRTSSLEQARRWWNHASAVTT